MKFSVLGLLLLAGSASAQYFSAGWSPGQEAPAAEPEVAPFVPGQSMEKDSSTPEPTNSPPPPIKDSKPFSWSSLLNTDTLLTSGPAVALFNKLGVNITERVLADNLWDKRVALITDENYKDLIENEELSPEEEKERVWVILVSAQRAKQDEVNKFIDKVYDSAFDQAQVAGDLPQVRWGRIDYLSVTYLTTKWAIWRAPYLIIATDRGRTLRFYHHYTLRFREENILHFLRNKEYLETPTWSTSFAPGGENEYIMDFAATWTAKLYNVTILIPNWLLLIITGGIGSLLIGLLHKPSKKTQPATPKPEQKITQTQPQPQVKKESSKQKGKEREVNLPTPAPASIPAPAPVAAQPKTAAPAPSAAAAAPPASPKPAPAAAALRRPGITTPGTTDSERESSVPPVGRRARQKKGNKKA